MNGVAQLVVRRPRSTWLVLSVATIFVGLCVTFIANEVNERGRLSSLQSEAYRHGIEIMSQTLNGNLMGSVAVLGLLDGEIKGEVLGDARPNSPRMVGMLGSVAGAHGAHGVFLVGPDGLVRSSWDSSGRPSTGTDVKFRPYFQMAMQRKENVYAAVSLARGDRSLYFTAPIFSDSSRNGAAIGGVVARTDLSKIDSMLRDKVDISLLLSPQGVVFAGNRGEWIGFLAERPSAADLAAIRELKQFGAMFETADPSILPVSTQEGRVRLDGRTYAVARARVQWNDPFGDWTLVLMEDLSRTVPLAGSAVIGTAAAGVAGALLLALLNLLRSRHAQQLAAGQLAQFARTQQSMAGHKAQLAAAAMRLQQAKTVSDLADGFLRESHAMFGTLQGLVYVRADDGGATMRLAAGYAVGAAVAPEISEGQGLLGECARDGRPRMLATPDEGPWTIESGLGDTRPGAVIMAPVQLNGAVLGVAEVAVLGVPAEQVLPQFEDLVGILALNLELVRRHQRTELQLEAASVAERVKGEQLAFQQVLVDAMPYPVFTLDAQARFLGANRACAEAFGMAGHDLIGRRMADLDILPEADRAAFQSESEAVIAAIGRTRRKLTLTLADGKRHDGLYFLSGFAGPDGSPGGLVGTLVDIGAVGPGRDAP